MGVKEKIMELFSKSELSIFLLSFAIIVGPAMSIMDSFDYSSLSPDIKTYLGLANGDFDQNAVRRYRIIVPFMASLVNFCFGFIFDKIQPWSFKGPDFSLGLSFLLINTGLLSLAAVYIFKILKHYKVSTLSSIIALLCFLSCRWSAYIAGLPWVDSLYFLMVVILLYSIITSNAKLLFIALLIGPLSKESFIFFYPLIIFYSNENWLRKIGFITSGVLLAFLVRFLIDYSYNFNISDSIHKDLDHFNQIMLSLKRMFSFHGIYELFSITSLFTLPFFFLLSGQIRSKVISNLPSFSMLFFVIIIFHAMLSSDLTRMYYLMLPLLCLVIGLILDELFSKNPRFEVPQ